MTVPLHNLTDVWNDSGTVFTAIKMNATDTASDAASKLMDLQVGGATRMSVTKGGVLGLDAGGGVGPVGISPDNANGAFQIQFGGNVINYFGLLGVFLTSGAPLAWTSSATSAVFTRDTFLYRDAANILAQRNATTAQTFRVYNTYTDASNYERGIFDWNATSNRLIIGSQAAGTGTLRDVEIKTGPGSGASLILSATTIQMYLGGSLGLDYTGATLKLFTSSATPAGGTTSLGMQLGTTTNFGIYFGSGAPTLSAAKGSLYLRSDGSGTTDRAYINTNGSTTWTAITTVA